MNDLEEKKIELTANYDGDRGYLIKKTELYRVKTLKEVKKIAEENKLQQIFTTNIKFIIYENGIKIS